MKTEVKKPVTNAAANGENVEGKAGALEALRKLEPGKSPGTSSEDRKNVEINNVSVGDIVTLNGRVRPLSYVMICELQISLLWEALRASREGKNIEDALGETAIAILGSQFNAKAKDLLLGMVEAIVQKRRVI